MPAEFYSADDHIEDSVSITNSAAASLAVIYLIAAVIFAIAAVIFIRLAWLFGILGSETMFVCFFVLTVYSFSERHVVYDQTYNNGVLEISKVRKNGKRKLMFSAECDSMEEMGKYNTDDTWWVKKSQDYKTWISFVGDELGVNKNIWVAFFNVEGKRTRIIFKPSEEMIKAIKRQYPSKVRYDEV